MGQKAVTDPTLSHDNGERMDEKIPRRLSTELDDRVHAWGIRQ
jgi:hypothetical protein